MALKRAGRIKILHVSPEAVPFSKVGGLADVAGSLPPALGELDADSRLLTPAWPGVLDAAADRGFKLTRITRKAEAAIRWRIYRGSVWKCSGPGMEAYLLDEPSLFEGPVYPDELTPYSATPFLFLSLAALDLPEAARWAPDVIHCHDWGTAPLSAALRWHRYFREAPRSFSTVFTIHNLAHQGLLPLESLGDWGIDPDGAGVDGFEFFGMANLMKAALIASDAITTVSPGYAGEIMTEEGGEGLGGLLRSLAPKVSGILNGLDDQSWNPASDPCLPAAYSHNNMAGKALCRQKLLEAAGWEDDGRPVFVSVGRMAEQKGLSILLPALERMTAMNCRLFIMGSGQAEYEGAVLKAASRFPDSVFGHIGYDEPLSRLAYGGGDFFIMPSRFEPCGLSQLIALRYGAIPVVRAVGGLKDTVFEEGPDKNGFVFPDYSPESLLEAVSRALKTFADKGAMAKLISGGMKKDYSWRQSAPLYKKLYESLPAR